MSIFVTVYVLLGCVSSQKPEMVRAVLSQLNCVGLAQSVACPPLAR